jgi:RNA polymerase sigma factor (sigma-70 family)
MLTEDRGLRGRSVGQRSNLVLNLRSLVVQDIADLSDAALLEAFLACREEAAFAVLVRRHGPLVLSVCRRVLGHVEDAEDAFQATFLVLARKAAAVRPRERLAAWLHGVAYHAALKLRELNARRRKRDRRVATMKPNWVEPVAAVDDLRAVLDEELTRLPDAYRLPVILCDLQGKTYRQAAQQLGWPEGTVSVRIARARHKLARQLTRRGITLSAAGCAAALAGQALAAVPTSLAASTTQACCLASASPASGLAADVAEGVIEAMSLTRLKMLTLALLALGLVALPLGYVALTAGQLPQADEMQGAGSGQPKTPARDPAQRDLEALQGVWGAIVIEREGKRAPAEVLEGFRVVFKGNRMTINPQSDNRTSTFTLDPAKQPAWFDAMPEEGPGKGQRLPAIYELDGDRLKLCFDNVAAGDRRPTEFRSSAENRLTLFVLTRIQPPPPKAAGFKDDRAQLEGSWKVVGSEFAGRQVALETTKLLTFAAGRFEERSAANLKQGSFALDPAAQPKTIDLHDEDGRTPALYRFAGEKLLLALPNGRGERPKDLESGPDDQTKFVLTLERISAEEAKSLTAQDARRRCGRQLQRVMLALHKYHDDHGFFPGPAITDQAGKPLLSWRVALLPYLEAAALYQEFRLDEPWDSEHNLRLLPRLPEVYRSVGTQPKDAGHTFVQVLTGADCLFEAGRKNAVDDIPDGTSQTIALILGASALPWTRPTDIDYAADQPLPSFVGGVLDDGLVSLAFADGSVHVTSNVFGADKERTFRAALTRNGGELIDLDQLK